MVQPPKIFLVVVIITTFNAAINPTEIFMSVNKVILLGNVGKEPDVRYFDQNSAVANFTLATTERAYVGKSGQQIPERTEWHNIVVRGGLVQVVERFVHKGSKLYVEGRIRSRSFDRDGQSRFITEIAVDVLEILSRRDAQTTAAPTHTVESHGTLGEPYGSSSLTDDAPFSVDQSDF